MPQQGFQLLVVGLKAQLALFPFRSAFTLAHYVRFHLTSVLRKIRLLDFTSGSLLLALLLKPNGFSRSAVRSPWRISQTNVCSMLRKIRSLGFCWSFAFWHSAPNSLFKEFCATLKLRTRRTSGFALRATQNPLFNGD